MASADILRAAHSPLPFEAAGEAVFSDTTCIALCDAWDLSDEGDEANAAFIVRACNAHYQMLEALENILGSLETTLELAYTQGGAKLLGSEKTEARIVAARAAIAAAEAEAGR